MMAPSVAFLLCCDSAANVRSHGKKRSFRPILGSDDANSVWAKKLNYIHALPLLSSRSTTRPSGEDRLGAVLTESAKRKRQRLRQRRILHWAQRGRCAGCGGSIGEGAKGPRLGPKFPTFDHLVLRSCGGMRTVANGLLKHRMCNEQRGTRPPSGCDLVWHIGVMARLRTDEAVNAWGECLLSALEHKSLGDQ